VLLFFCRNWLALLFINENREMELHVKQQWLPINKNIKKKLEINYNLKQQSQSIGSEGTNLDSVY
jgi:hypothetical protein